MWDLSFLVPLHCDQLLVGLHLHFHAPWVTAWVTALGLEQRQRLFLVGLVLLLFVLLAVFPYSFRALV